MARARRGRVNLLGIDPGYTRQAEREGKAYDEAQGELPGPPSEDVIAVELHDASGGREEPRGSEQSDGLPAKPSTSPSKSTGMTRQVRVGLSVKTSEQLAEISREQGVSIAVIGKALRARVIVRFMRLLEKGERPTDQVVHRGGHAERVFVRLQGEPYDRARDWFDPMNLGEAAMADAMRPVLARLFDEELRRIARH